MRDDGTEAVVELEGPIIVEFHGNRLGAPVFVATSFIHADTGMPIITALDCTLSASNDRGEWLCEMEMLADDNGRPLIKTGQHQVLTECYTEDGDVRTGRFTWLVKEFRAAP